MVLTHYQDTRSKKTGNPMWVLKFMAQNNQEYPLYLTKQSDYTKKRLDELRRIALIGSSREEDLFEHLKLQRTPMRIWLKMSEGRFKIYSFQSIKKSNIREIIVNQIDIEKSLYVLHKIGIVKDWTKEYRTDGETIHVEMNKENQDIEHIKENAKKYLCSYDGTDQANEYVQKIDGIENIDQFTDLILSIRRWYHDTFITLKREQIANMYSLIERFKNQDRSNEIQSLIEDYFDISSYIGRVGESFLDFESKTFVDVISSAFERNHETLEKVKLQIERKLESFVDLKTDVFAGIIHLRSNSYLTDRNGKQRFEETLKKLDKSDIEKINQHILNSYEALSMDSRLHYINTIEKYVKDIIENVYDTQLSCALAKGLMCVKINQLLGEEVWQ